MKDIHLKINPIVELFARGCSLNFIPHYYVGHSHFDRGIDMNFKVLNLNTDFITGLQQHFDHFSIRYERGHMEVVIRVFNDDDADIPF